MHKLFVILCSAISIYSVISYSYATTSGGPLHLTVVNKLGKKIESARLKVEATNSWKELGAINDEGSISTTMPGKLNAIPGLLEIQLDDRQKMDAVFDKSENDSNIEIVIKNKLITDINSKNTVLPTINVQHQAGTNSRIGVAALGKSTSGVSYFSPIAHAQGNNSWSAKCGGVGLYLAVFDCVIYSEPTIRFCGQGVAMGLSVSKGSFSSGKSPDELVKAYHYPKNKTDELPKWSYLSLAFYTHIWAPDGWFNGGGIGFGSGGGEAYYTKDDACQTLIER